MAKRRHITAPALGDSTSPAAPSDAETISDPKVLYYPLWPCSACANKGPFGGCLKGHAPAVPWQEDCGDCVIPVKKAQ
jgi:hypothetical protein